MTHVKPRNKNGLSCEKRTKLKRATALLVTMFVFSQSSIQTEVVSGFDDSEISDGYGEVLAGVDEDNLAAFEAYLANFDGGKGAPTTFEVGNLTPDDMPILYQGMINTLHTIVPGTNENEVATFMGGLFGLRAA